MPDNISKLYGELKDTYELGSEADFRKYLSDGKNREALRKELEAEYDVGDSASFTKYLGLDAKPQPTAKPQQPTDMGAKTGGLGNLVAKAQQKPKVAVTQQQTQQSVVKPQPTAQPQSKPQPLEIPEGFGQLDMQQANQMAMGKGAVRWDNPQGQEISPQTGKAVTKEPNIANQIDKAIKGDKKAAKDSGLDTAVQRMQEEREYYEATGKPLANIVNTPFTAPTAVKDEDGQMLLGQTTDEQRVAQYQQQEKDVARRKLIQPIVDDIQKQLEGKVPLYTSPINMSSGPQWNAEMNQTEQLRRMNEADSPEKLWGALNEYFGIDKAGDDDFTSKFLVDNQDAINEAAARLGMNTDDFVWKELIPKMSETIAERFNQNMSEKYSVKDTGDYLAKRMINSSIGALARMATMTPQQSQFMQEGLERSNQGEGQHFNAAWYDKAIGEVAQFLPDAPLMMIGGAVGGAATKSLGTMIARAGAEGLGTMIATGSPFLAANVGKLVKYGGLLGHAVIGGAANMGSFMGMSSMMQAMASTPVDEGYFSSIAMAGWEGMKEGAKIGTALGVLGTISGAGNNLWKTAKGRAAWAGGTFLAENQIFALSDYLADPDKFNWVDSSLDALYMQMAAKVQGVASHGTESIKNSWRQIFNPMPKMPTLTESEKETIRKSFGGLSFEQIAGDMKNLEKILSDKQNIPLTIRQKISGRVLGVFEPNRPYTYNINIRGNEIFERAKSGELLQIHTFNTPEERDIIMQQIADRKWHDQMVHDFNMLDMKEQVAPVLDAFAQEFGMTRQELWDMMQKKPIDLVDDEYDLMRELGRRLHDANVPNGEIHTEQSNTDGAELAGNGGVMNPDAAAQVSQELADALDAYLSAPRSEEIQQALNSLGGNARLDDIYMYIRDNFSGPEVDQFLSTLADYANAKAKADGFIDKTGMNIDEQVAQEIDKNSFHGTIDDASDIDNIISITKDGVRYTLLNGNIGTRVETLNGVDGQPLREGRFIDPDRSGGMIIAIDDNGNWAKFQPDANIEIAEVMPKEDYGNNLRESLQQEASRTAIETGLVQPEEPQPVEEKGVELDNAGGEAGQQPTGGNEPPATTPSEPATNPTPKAISKIPTLKDEHGADILDDEGDAQYQWEQAPLDDTLNALVEINGGDRKSVTATVDAMFDDAKKAVEKADKLTPKGKDPIKIARHAAEIKAQQEEARKKLDYWTKAKEALEKANKPETELKDEASENNVPDNSVPLQPKAASEQKSLTVEEQKQRRIEEAKAAYGELFDDDFDKANDVYELVSMWVGRGRFLAWDDVNGKRGLQKELGWVRKIGGDTKYIETILAKNGEGMGVDEFAHMVWESEENTANGEKRYSTEEIKEALLDLLKSATSKSDVVDHALNSRIAAAEKALKEQREREAEEAQMQPTEESQEVEDIPDGDLPFGRETDENFPEAPAPEKPVEIEDAVTKTLLTALTPEERASLEGKNPEEIRKELVDSLYKYLKDENITLDDLELPDEIRNELKKEIDEREREEGTAENRLEPSVEKEQDESADKPAGEPERTEPVEKREAEPQPTEKTLDRKQALEKEREELIHRRNKLLSKGLKLGIYDKEKATEGLDDVYARLKEIEQELNDINSRKETPSEKDEYLKPRNEKEKQIISDVEAKLAAEIKAAKDEVKKTKIALEKARGKESERATDMFSDDKAFEKPDQLFSFEEMGGTDRSAEGVERRIEGERMRYKEADKKLAKLLSKEEHDSRVRGALDNERRQTGIDLDGKTAEHSENPMEVIERQASDFQKEEDAQLGIIRDETPEQKAQAEGDVVLNEEPPLTEADIDGSSLSDVQKTWAKAYLNGKTDNELYTNAYLEAYEDVRNRRQDNAADSRNADGTQLVGGEDNQQRGLVSAGEQAGDVAEGGNVPEQVGERTDGGRIPSMENRPDDVPASSGERGDSSVSESKPEVDRPSAGGEQPVGSSGTRSNGRDVRRTGSSERSSRVAGQAEQRDVKARRQELKNQRDELLARLKALKEQEKKEGRLQMAVLPPIPSGIDSYIPKDKEQRKVFWELATTTAEYGYTYLEEGITKFNEWKRKVFEDFVEPIKDFFGWGQNEVDHYIEQVWNSDYNINGVTRTMSEWASFLGQENLRKVISVDRNTKFEQQKAAESIDVKTGDIDNIRETLPYLLPEQQDDVMKAETQFFDEKHQDREHGFGKGIMFTNGTGTGKTYTGLGIVKRFVRQGKGRVLILTPSQEKVSDWRKDGLNLGLNIESLDEEANNLGVSATKAKGKGVVVTTYANARQNLKMLEDCFDLIVYDESHKIMESKEATGTTMLKFHEMLTNKNVEKSIDRQTYYLPLWVEQRNLWAEQAFNDEVLDAIEDLKDDDKQIKIKKGRDEYTFTRKDKERLQRRNSEILARLLQIPEEQRPIRESKREQAEIDSKKTKTVFLSATPFNVRESLKYAEGYLFSFPEEDKNTVGSYNHRSPEDAFFEQMFPAGYRWRYGRLENHVANAEALGRQEIDFSDYLQNTLQTMSGRMIASDYDYSRDFPVMTLDHAGRFNQAMSEVYKNKRYQALANAFRKCFDYNYSTALFEAMKTSLVNDRIKEHLARGHKVVVFHRRRTSGDLEPPFRRALDLAEVMASNEQDQQTKSKIRSAIAAFEHDFADMLEWEQTLDYTLPRDQIEKVFGKDRVAFFSGAETKTTKHKSVEDFMKDNGGKDIIVIQEASGKEGISLHDQTGEHQRVEINLALPQSPIAFIQIEGRIYRIGQKSNAIFEYPLLGLDLETNLFAQKFNGALGTTENLALGSKARNLRKSIANSVLENTGEVDYERQGLGGKDMDGRVSEAADKDGFDISIQDYYGNQKMKRGRDNREGVDYFPTPEPIGYKMVEWGQMMEGETALEPSAGHGAIARYIPETNGMTAIEPSSSLFTKLQMRAGGPGRRFEEMAFEDYPLANKHDVVLMNPPYGVGGKTAMEHVAKAFKHLNEGGRVIAIIPDGPSMDKRLDAWLASRSNGVAYGVDGSAVVVGEVKLPSVAFGRAGTSVMTRVVVIDKISRAQMREKAPQKVTIDLSGEDSIGGLFDRIRNVRMPERTIDQVAINTKKALRTKKALEDNPFCKEFYIEENNATSRLIVKSRSKYEVSEINLNLANPSMENVLLWYKNFKETMEHPEKLECGKYVGKFYGTGKNQVPKIDAIKDFCQQAIKTLENVTGVTADQMDKTIREQEAERERRRQEQEERIRQMQEERARQRQEKLDTIKRNIEEGFTGEGIYNNVEQVKNWVDMYHSNGTSPFEKRRAKFNIEQAGFDPETGKKIDKNEPVNSRTATAVVPQQPTQRKADYSYKLDRNTRTGADMHLVSYNGARLSDADYRATERKAKAHNGYYNRFKKAFHFDTEADARKFAEEMNGSTREEGTTTRFRLREKEAPKKTQKVYKLVRLGDDGNAYPLFIDSANPMEMEKWYDADSPDMSILKKMPEGTFLVDYENGTYKTLEEYAKEKDVKVGKNPSVDMINEATANGQRFVRILATDKGQRRYEGENRKYMNIGINGSGQVGEFAMRPGWHAGSLPSMRQIGKGKDRNLRDDKFVWLEGEVPADIDYQSEADMNPDKDIPTHIPEDGYYLKATNANKAASQADKIGWYVAGAFKPNRYLSDWEARKVIDDWNAEHPDDKVEYDFERESGKEFNAETMQLEDRPTTRFSKREKTEEKLNNKYKDEKSEDLFLSLSQKEGEDLYESAEEINRRVESGDARIVRLGEEAERGRRTAFHRIASLLAGNYTDRGSSRALGEIPEESGREGIRFGSKRESNQEKTRLLNQKIAERVSKSVYKGGRLISEAKAERDSLDGKKYASASESNVYRTPDGKHVVKFTVCDDNSYDNSLLKRLDDMALFNTVFPDSAYDVIGLASNGAGRLKVVSEQPYFEGETAIAHFKDSNKAYEFIDNYLENTLKLKPLKDEEGDTYAHTKGDLIIRDVNYENVIIDKEGKPHVIDCQVERLDDTGRERKGNLSVVDTNSTRMRSRDGENPIEADFERKRKAGEKLAKKLNSDFEAVTELDQIQNKEVRDAIAAGHEVPGWIEIGKDGKKKIFMYLPHVRDTYDAEKTIAHETIGHQGLRELLGEKGYKSYCRSLLYDLKDPELQKYWMENLAKNGFDTYRTIDEFLAEAAEKGYGDLSMWQKVKNAMTDALHSAGFTMSPSISDVKYMVWLSKHNLEKGNVMNQVEREALLYRLGKERYEAKVRNGEFGYEGGRDTTTDTTRVPYFPGDGKTLFRHTPSVKNQRMNYERSLKRIGYVWKESHIDAMQSAIELMRSISGVKKIEDIPSAENFVLLENQMSSKEEQMDFLFNRDYMKPLDDAVSVILPDMPGRNIDTQLRNLQTYMIKKHGLERNRVLFVRDAIRELRKNKSANQQQVDDMENDYFDTMRDLRDDLRNGIIDLKEYFEEVDKWIKHNIPQYTVGEKDYSGLTGLSTVGKLDRVEDALFIDDVMTTESMLGDKRVNDLWTRTKAVSQFGLDMEYEGGIDSKDKHDKVSQMFEWYVPLRGYDEKSAEEVYDYLEERGGSSRKWAGSVLMNAKGRESLADVDVFATLGSMSSSAINRALRNQMKQAFARFVRSHYNEVDADNRLVTELPYLWAEKQHDPMTGADVWVEKFPDIPENAKADDIAQIVEQYQQDMKAKEATGDAKRVRQNSNIPFRPADAEHKAQHIVDVYINGEKHSFIVNGNPRAAQAINGQLKAERNSNILWLSSLSHFMAKMNTSYSPDFIMRNTERDFIYSAANIAVKENAEYWFRWAKNYGVAIGRVSAGVPAMHTNLFKRYRNGNLNMTNSTDRYFKEFMENGGETGWVEHKNLDKWRKEIKKGVKAERNLEKAGNLVVNALPDAIEAMNERAENMARFATYMTSRQMGRSITRSVSDAKEVSVNFNRKGAGKKTVGMNRGDNSWLSNANAYMAGWSAQNLQDYIMFYNAGVQGMTNMIKNVANHPIKGNIAFALFAMGGMLIPRLNQMLFEEDDDKTGNEPENPYAELPEYVRRNNLCIYSDKGSFITIALPIELRAMYGIGDMAASYISHPELRSTKNAGVDILTQLSQVAPLDFFGEGAGPMWTMVPSGIRPLAEAAANKNWLGQPIERDEERWNENKPRWTRAFKNVGDTYVGASKRINAATNPYGDENIKGWADGAITDPALVEHVINGYFGGVGSTVNRVAMLAKHADEMSPKDAITSNWMPIVRTQHYTPNERTRYARTRNKWWYYKEEMDKTNEVIKTLKKRGEHDPISFMQSISEEEGKKGDRAKTMDKAYKEYSKIKAKLEKTDDLQEKNIYQLQMDQLMEETVRELDKMK